MLSKFVVAWGIVGGWGLRYRPGEEKSPTSASPGALSPSPAMLAEGALGEMDTLRGSAYGWELEMQEFHVAWLPRGQNVKTPVVDSACLGLELSKPYTLSDVLKVFLEGLGAPLQGGRASASAPSEVKGEQLPIERTPGGPPHPPHRIRAGDLGASPHPPPAVAGEFGLCMRRVFEQASVPTLRAQDAKVVGEVLENVKLEKPLAPEQLKKLAQWYWMVGMKKVRKGETGPPPVPPRPPQIMTQEDFGSALEEEVKVDHSGPWIDGSTTYKEAYKKLYGEKEDEGQNAVEKMKEKMRSMYKVVFWGVEFLQFAEQWWRSFIKKVSSRE